MDHEIDPVGEAFVQGSEQRVHTGDVLHVTGDHDIGAEGGGQWLHAAAESFPLIGERELGPVLMQGLGDAPGDGMIVGDP